MVKSVAEIFKGKSLQQVLAELEDEAKECLGNNYVAGHTHKNLPHDGVMHIFDNPAGVPYAAVWYNGQEVNSSEYRDGEGEQDLYDWWMKNYQLFVGVE